LLPVALSPYRVAAPDAKAPLQQGEILTDVVQFRLNVASLGTASALGAPFRHPFSVVLTQDCDLEQDHRIRFPAVQASDKLIPGVLFCEAVPAEELYAPIIATQGRKSKAWDRIQQNNDIRYHFLQKVEPGSDRLNEGLPELALDFKRYFTLPTEEIYRRIELGEARRRCVLISPYLEHLSSRFAYYLSRVALPEDHASE
jgi:hypothetical protein